MNNIYIFFVGAMGGAIAATIISYVAYKEIKIQIKSLRMQLFALRIELNNFDNN